MNMIFKAASAGGRAVLSTPASFLADDSNGTAAGSDTVASGTARHGSVATIVAAGVGAAAVIGAVVAGSTSNGSSTSTSTSTSTSK